MKTREEFAKEMSNLGRIGILIVLSMLFAVPTIFGLYLDAMPTFGEFMRAASGLLVLFVPLAISEVFIYAPILGSASYITFITGNIMNLKIPIAQNAQELMDTTKGSEQSDIITTLAISVSAIVTICSCFRSITISTIKTNYDKRCCNNSLSLCFTSFIWSFNSRVIKKYW